MFTRILVTICIVGFSSTGHAAPKQVSKHRIVGDHHFVDGYPAVNADGTVNVVIEIPTGTTEKWEVNKTHGDMRWELRKGKPRIVQYLGYPGNYGMVPRTVLDKTQGGDGDPIDVLILGPALPRGSIVAVRMIGVLKTLDRGEIDDKLIAVLPAGPFAKIDSIKELQKKRKGAAKIIQTWFSNYKGPGKMKTKGYKGPRTAYASVQRAMTSYEKAKALPAH